MPKIDQLPSGTYRARIYDYTDSNNKKHYKSITGSTKKEVKLKIAEYETNRSVNRVCEDMTVHGAIQHYIDVKSNVTSPATIRGYNIILRNRLQRIMNVPVSRLTMSDIQAAINDDAKRLSPKTIRNTNALLKSAIELVSPQFKYSVTLPQKIKPDITIPSETEMLNIFKAARGTKIETAIYLAAMCGMRRSEIVALKWSDVDLENGTISINSAAVADNDNKIVYKATKTTSSKRTIKVFAPVLKILKEKSKDGVYVESFSHPHRVTELFGKLLKNNNLPHYRFHDLRHYAVSTMLLLNLPKKYIADYMGHETEHMIDTVYGHIMQDKKLDLMAVVDTHFTAFSQRI